MNGPANEANFPATAMPDPDWWEVLWPEPEKVLEKLGVKPGLVAIDLCCGDGLFTVPLAACFRQVYAIDLDSQLLMRASVRIAGTQNCTFIQGDAYEVASLVPERVDYVLLANTFHGVPDKERFSGAVASILVPGGQFIIVNWHAVPREQTVVLGQPRGPRSEMRMDPADVARAVEPAGLRLSHVVELPP
jgi:SAM-dependent methyltransferase